MRRDFRGPSWSFAAVFTLALVSACGDDSDADASSDAGHDAAHSDTSTPDTTQSQERPDAGSELGSGEMPEDSSEFTSDTSQGSRDAGTSDVGVPDAAANTSDTPEVSVDAATGTAPLPTDTAPTTDVGDAGTSDAGLPDTDSSHWRPQAGLSWQWQLSTDVEAPLDVEVYDIDWETDPEAVSALHELGIRVICYVSVGSWEDFRPDVDAFDEAVLGEDYEGWPGERYVDIRSPALRAIMEQRFDVCQASGFDAIEPDNMDVFELGSDSGFDFTRQDGIDYALWLAEQAHARGLGIGQKNASSITAEISAQYDWALTESCYSDGEWCSDVQAYVDANKPVFMCEYEADTFEAACDDYQGLGYSPILKSLDLDAEISFCP